MVKALNGCIMNLGPGKAEVALSVTASSGTGAAMLGCWRASP